MPQLAQVVAAPEQLIEKNKVLLESPATWSLPNDMAGRHHHDFRLFRCQRALVHQRGDNYAKLSGAGCSGTRAAREAGDCD